MPSKAVAAAIAFGGMFGLAILVYGLTRIDGQSGFAAAESGIRVYSSADLAAR